MKNKDVPLSIHQGKEEKPAKEVNRRNWKGCWRVWCPSIPGKTVFQEGEKSYPHAAEKPHISRSASTRYVDMEVV